MTQRDRETFDNLCGGPLVEVAGHVPSIHVNGATVRVKCSCGATIQKATGCNRPGISYAIYAAKDAYRKHVANVMA